MGTRYGIRVIYDAYRDPNRDQSRAEEKKRLQAGAAQQAHGGTTNAQESEKGIYSIYRFFDIDKQWWARETWEGYCGSSAATLYRTLKDGARTKLTLVAPLEYPQFDDASMQDKALFFGKFIGLVWHYVVLWHVRRALEADSKDVCEHRIRIAKTSLWLHVVDRTVYQILGDDLGEDVKVRNLTHDMDEISVSLARWAKREIQTLAARGPTAEEYICTCLTDAHQAIPADCAATFGQNEDHILERLGFHEWANEGNAPAGKDVLAPRCKALIRDAMAIIATSEPRKAATLGGEYDPSIAEIAAEVQ
jgi:hypothetical protein